MFSGVGLDEEEDLEDEYQAITENEEKDLDTLMSSCQTAISNAEAFMENLAKDLSLLDGVIQGNTFLSIFYVIKKFHILFLLTRKMFIVSYLQDKMWKTSWKS